MTVHWQTEILGKVVVPGETWPWPSNDNHLRIVVRCETVNPNSYTAAVFFHNQELTRTGEHPNMERAVDDANKLIGDAFTRLFS